MDRRLTSPISSSAPRGFYGRVAASYQLIKLNIFENTNIKYSKISKTTCKNVRNIIFIDFFFWLENLIIKMIQGSKGIIQ